MLDFPATKSDSWPDFFLPSFSRWMGQLGRSARTTETYSRLLRRYFAHSVSVPCSKPGAVWVAYDCTPQIRRVIISDIPSTPAGGKAFG